MSEASRWVFTICSGALLCGVVSILIPSKSYERSIQLLLGLFMLFCFLMPVSMHWEPIFVDLEEAERFRLEAASGIEKQIYETAEDQGIMEAEKIVDSTLVSFGIKPDERTIYIIIDDGEAGEGKELTVQITLPARLEKNHDSIQNTLEQELGAKVLLQYSKE